MPHQFTVSLDYTARALPGWFLFNTWLQRALGQEIHLEVFDDPALQSQAVREGRVDFYYANPYDATNLIRNEGFLAVAAPRARFDEALIAVRADSPVDRVEELLPGLRVAATRDQDVRRMCMILLEPADLHGRNVTINTRESYVLVAKALLQAEADVGFFLEATFGELSNLVKSALRPLIRSRISTIRHVLLVSPQFGAQVAPLKARLEAMVNEERGKNVLDSLGFEAWEGLEQEDVEFMIDLMDTLIEKVA